MTTIVIETVGPFVFLPENGELMPWYRDCDICQQSACEDIWAGKLNEADWRGFNQIHGGPDDGLVVCDHCIEKYLAET